MCSRSLGRGSSSSSKYHEKLRNPLFTKFVQSVEDPRLKALQDHAVRALNLPIRARVCHGGPINADVVVITESEKFFIGELCVVVYDDGVWELKAVDDVK